MGLLLLRAVLYHFQQSQISDLDHFPITVPDPQSLAGEMRACYYVNKETIAKQTTAQVITS